MNNEFSITIHPPTKDHGSWLLFAPFIPHFSFVYEFLNFVLINCFCAHAALVLWKCIHFRSSILLEYNKRESGVRLMEPKAFHAFCHAVFAGSVKVLLPNKKKIYCSFLFYTLLCGENLFSRKFMFKVLLCCLTENPLLRQVDGVWRIYPSGKCINGIHKESNR